MLIGYPGVSNPQLTSTPYAGPHGAPFGTQLKPQGGMNRDLT